MTMVSNEQVVQAPNPDVTVAAERGIDESTVLKTCHQCHQMRPLIGSCVTKKGETTCSLKLCRNCLRNRYGENAEEVTLKTDWVCPKCRGICNCSYCMKKRGHMPTGILVRTAKVKGFSSASELLKNEGPNKYFYKRKVKPEDAIEAVPLTIVAAPLERGQENSEQNHVKIKKSKKSKREELQVVNNGGGNDQAAVDTSSTKKIKASKDAEGNKIKKRKPVLKKKEEYQLEEVMPPQGTSLITVSGIELPREDVGAALQFLEFCSTFEKALDLRKGQAESVVREMFARRDTRRQEHSTLTGMIIQILTVILKDRGQTSLRMSATDSSWFTAVGICFLESDVKLDDFRPEFFKRGIVAYEELDSSKRLKLLNFLCDELLGTSQLRDCIDDVETIQRKKEGKEMLNAAKEKEKQLKQILEDELAKAVAENGGVPLTTEEHDAIASQMNAENEEVRSEMLSAMEMLSTKNQKCNDALRTKPLEVDDNGLVFWKLKCYNEEPNILVQDLGSGSDEIPQEKWYAFSPEQKPQLEKYIRFVRAKRCQAKRQAKQNASTST